MSTRYRTVLFDLDGTLTDPMVGITGCVQHALADAGIVIDDPTTLTGYIGPPLLEGFALFHGLEGPSGERAVACYRERYLDTGIFENEVIPGIPELLAELQDEGVTMAITTSKVDWMAERILDHFGLDRFFAFVGGATLDGRRRSKADVIEHTLAHLGIDRDRDGVVLVGDREHDVLGALAAGVEPIGVRWGYAVPGELEAAGATTIVASVAELRDTLR